jgi:hypothetical protein
MGRMQRLANDYLSIVLWSIRIWKLRYGASYLVLYRHLQACFSLKFRCFMDNFL